ncbi:MAG: (Fe-S)-binding protein [Desulfosarcinaceae bacterium]
MSAPVFTDNPDRCMKCGFCMSNCPVYRVDYIESHVARGRNMLIRRAAAGNLPRGDTYAQSLSHCLLCGRCRAVCPARVSSPDITVAGRAEMVRRKGLPWPKALVFRGILKHRNLMARLAGLAAMLPGIGDPDGRPLRHMADLTAAFSGGIAVPRLSRPFLARRLKPVCKPAPGTAPRGRVGLFAGCGFEFFFAGMGQAMVAVLNRAGFEVVYPKAQGCCGMAVHNAGDLVTAKHMAKANIAAFEGLDGVVTGCATCSTALKEYHRWIPQDDPWQVRAAALSEKTWDFSHFLHHHGAAPPRRGKRPLKVTYHDPCHLKWHQGISQAPRELLARMEDIEYIEMEGADDCCGLGGAFGLYHRDISLAIQKKKMKSIAATRADVVATSCPGCQIQLMDGARRFGLDIDVMHIGQLINLQELGE